MKKNIYNYSLEWPYKNIKPRIIIEQYLEEDNLKEIQDYKFFCFNGIPKIMYISKGSTQHDTASLLFLDMDYNVLDWKRKDYKIMNQVPQKPVNFETMKRLSAILSANIPHVRIDWYEINGKLYFGEFTFYTAGGFIPFEDEKWDYELGNMIKLDWE